MRIVYIHSGSASVAADLLDEHAAAIDGARVLHDTGVDEARRDTLLTLLAGGDELLVPGLEHLGGTAEAALASLRRAVEAGARVTLLRDGLDGAAVVRATALLEALPTAADAASPEPPRGRRAYRRATPNRIAEILTLSVGGAPIRAIAATVGLSAATVMRVRQAHRASWHAAWSAGCQGSAD